MPQHIAKPIGPGDHSEWTPSGAATAWQAWADELQSSFVTTADAGRRVRVVFESLPVDAATVSRVSIVLLAAGDDVGSFRPVPRLAGVDDTTAEASVPPPGGYAIILASFDSAPGGLPWTVARRNAMQAGIDSILAPDDAGNPLNVDRLRLATDYEPAAPTAPPGEPAELEFPSRGIEDLTFSGSPELTLPTRATQDLSFPGTPEVSFASRAATQLDFRKSS